MEPRRDLSAIRSRRKAVRTATVDKVHGSGMRECWTAYDRYLIASGKGTADCCRPHSWSASHLAFDPRDSRRCLERQFL